MTDIFHEVEEEVRRERWEKLWKEYGDYIIAAAALLVIAAAGWQVWRYYEHREQVRSSAEYMAAQQLLDSGQTPAAAEAFGKIAASAPHGYAEISRLQEAGALQSAGRTADAVKLYTEIMANGDDILASVARLRVAWATADTSSRADLEKLLAPLTGATSVWDPMAREILAYSDFHYGKTAEALAAYKKLAAEKNLPESLHQRSAAMATYLAAGAGQNFGTVPPPPAPKAIAPAQTPAAAPTQGSQKK
ncbi:MAG: tetratricopeptide repeat protein [Proteobacteria bacterium]|nr:tetratricopeptide repeat protein [Pseudomonadota bacterium]